ncbi:hypothetical protein SB717_34690, partial [Priestia sp. SIMBA_032]|uniref:hypothetical protein n=1 Tax=Priestia sp. SIMBA_032 TaxID=3085775 RepID=UPI003979E5C4
DTHDDAQQRYYLTETCAQFIHLTDPQAWRLGLTYLQRTDALELAKTALSAAAINYEHFIADSPTNPLAVDTGRQLVEQSLQRYHRSPGTTPWPDGEAGLDG